MGKLEQIAVVALVNALKEIAEKVLDDSDKNNIPDIFDSLLELFGIGDEEKEGKE